MMKSMNVMKKAKKTKIMAKSLLTCLTLFISSNVLADNVTHVIWNKDFIPIQLPLNKEKIIEVCAPSHDPDTCNAIPLTPYLPQEELANGSLKWINNNGTLYLNAIDPFSDKLAELKLNDSTGEVILVRLTATSRADTNRVDIILPNRTSDSDSSSSSTVSVGQEDQSLGDMVRFVAQQLYAPERLLTQPNWIYRVPMRTDHFIPFYRGSVVSAMPLASWRSGDYYISAILLRNVLNEPVTLRYDLIRGQWIAVSFFRQGHLNPFLLMPARTEADTTTAIVVSSVPLSAALQEGINHE